MRIDIFENYLKNESVFKNKSVLSSVFIPETLHHREKEIEIISAILAPSLKFEPISNVFIYGKPGTGKTVTMKYISRELENVAKKYKKPLEIVYVNCKLNKIADTEYRLLAYLLNYFGKKVPATGIPTQELYRLFFHVIDETKRYLILILDEIDQLVEKSGDELLYILLRKNEELKNSYLTIIGISNNLGFTQSLDPRIKSSLSEEEIIFEPYNALQLKDILKTRANQAFKPNAIEHGLIEKCAAYAAREHGDARRAIDLLRLAGELADREGSKIVKISHLDAAQEKMESDKYIESIRSQPKQYQAVLYAIILLYEKGKEIHTGDVYDLYIKLVKDIGLRPLTQRRVSDIINDFDALGILNVQVVSHGRYGRTRSIALAYPKTLHLIIKGILGKELGIE